MATRMCDVCGIRPAVVSVRRIIPGEGERVEHLCEIHAAEAGVLGGSAFEGSPLGGGRLGRGSLFDDFFGRFFDDEPFGTRGGGMANRRQTEQVDITQFFSDATTELLQRAPQQAVEWGSLDLTSEHLLYAALEDRVVRRVLEEVGADPEAVMAQLEEEAEKGGRTDVSPSLAPDAKGHEGARGRAETPQPREGRGGVEVGVSAIIQKVILVGVDKYSMQQLIGISLVLAALGAILWVHMHERRQRNLFASPGAEAVADPPIQDRGGPGGSARWSPTGQEGGGVTHPVQLPASRPSLQGARRIVRARSVMGGLHG